MCGREHQGSVPATLKVRRDIVVRRYTLVRRDIVVRRYTLVRRDIVVHRYTLVRRDIVLRQNKIMVCRYILVRHGSIHHGPSGYHGL